MLFNSPEFIFLFLPMAWLAYRVLNLRLPMLAIAWLAMASLFFYGWWNPAYVGLLLFSVFFNYSMGSTITRLRDRRNAAAKALLSCAVLADLALLGYYKYTNFLLDVAGSLGAPVTPGQEILLPLGISFFTFTQIAFLVDAYQGKAREYNFVHYLLFVTYFPHLIAGPILHHSEMMPQFATRAGRPIPPEDIAAGVVLFIAGLVKKVLIADNLSPHASGLFELASQGYAVTFFEAWTGTIAYTLQLYFDFSGYSDMALGLSLLFGIRLPANFNSPYRATSIIDFWRRWHMTLSRFLRDYLYIPLGGNRHGPVRRYANLFLTMLLGGLWHGAGWTFVVWGALHGSYLIINHAWRALFPVRSERSGVPAVIGHTASLLLTFAAVCVAWVFFRSPDIATAWNVLRGMAGVHGALLPMNMLASESLGNLVGWLAVLGVEFGGMAFPRAPLALLGMLPLLLVVWLLPNTQQWLARYRPVLGMAAVELSSRLSWSFHPAWGGVAGAAFALCLLSLNRVSEFLYYQF